MKDTKFIDKAIIACMQGLQANSTEAVAEWNKEDIARYSVSMAEWLLKERNRLIGEIRRPAK